MLMELSKEDIRILRETARLQMEYASMERNEQLKKEWEIHNSLQGEKPMVHLEMATFAQEIIPDLLQCQGTFAREIETAIYCNFLNQKLFEDDRVTPDYFAVNYIGDFHLFDIPVQVEYSKDKNENPSLGHHFIPSISDLEEDYGKLKTSRFWIDLEQTRLKKRRIEEAIGDILPVRLQMDCLTSVPTQMLVHIMSMEDMLCNMMDYPDLFKEMMGRIAEDTLSYFRMLEREGLILPTTGNQSLGQGSWCYNHELPGWEEHKKRPFITRDVWGFMDSQETVGISPEMFEELIFPCYEKISSQFGLLSYGCCEPVDPIWERCISRLKNLRKVSISPWCKEEWMGERLRGSSVIFHRKPSPNYLGIGSQLDEEAFRAHIRKSLLAAKGCKMEITQRDVYTINRDIGKAHRYVELIRQEIEEHWN